jgi:lauroyl/myristoyl acyltransferase
MARWLAGLLSVSALKALSFLPPRLIFRFSFPFLPLYSLARQSVRHRLQYLRDHIPAAPISPAYYRMRLRLAALTLRHLTGHWKDAHIRVEGGTHYQSALAGGKPVALIGWHQGPVELLHHIPPPPPDGRPFFIATAKGFSIILTRWMRQGRKQAGKETVAREGLPNALRSWTRQRGVMAVMMDQNPEKDGDRLLLWNGAVEIPFPRKLWNWIVSRDAVLLAVTARLQRDGSILFRYEPVSPDEDGLKKLMETALVEDVDQYNWSYPKIRIAKKPD